MSKDEILAVAEKQMKTGGYENLSFRAIAEEMKISKANVHHHFKTKLELATAVANHYANIYNDQFDQLGQSMAPDYLGFIYAMEDIFWEEAELSGSCNVCVCAQLTKPETVPDELYKVALGHFDRMVSIFSKYAKVAQEAGTIRQDIRPEEVALQTGIVVHGIMSLSQTFPSVSLAKKTLFKQGVRLLETLRG